MDILCNGCSFSYSWTRPSKKKKNISKRRSAFNSSYCCFLPGEVYNIAKRGSGIESVRLKKFLKKNIQLTHFIYQIPDPSRQPVCLKDDDNSLWCCPRDQWMLPKILWGQLHSNNIEAFAKQEAYFKRAIDKVQESVNLIRTQQPDVKIIILRYAYHLYPLIYEFSYPFYKDILSNFCKNNNITYIYEDNFNSKWFANNDLAGDECHPNKAGAKMIADKIIEYL